MHNSAHMASLCMGTLPRKVHPENAKLKYSEISTLQNRQINMQLKYSVQKKTPTHIFFHISMCDV